MRGLGTIINAGAIIAGGLLGLAGGRFLKKSMQDTLMKATGVCVMFIGIGGAIEEMMTVSGQSLVSGSTMMMIGSMDRVAADLLRRGKSNLGEKTEGGEYAAGDFGCSGLGLCVKMRPDTEEHKTRARTPSEKDGRMEFCMKKRIGSKLICLFFACLLLAGLFGAAAFAENIEETEDTLRAESSNAAFTDTKGINSWWVYPLSVRYKGKYDKTYTSYVGSDGYCGLISYNNRSGKRERVNIVKEKADDHNAGAVEVLPDGRILYITSGHNTRNYLKVFVSKNREMIREWEEPFLLHTPAKCTYIQLIKTKNGYYLFTRLRYSSAQIKNASKRYTWAVSFSRDGLNWSAFRNIINGGTNQYYIKAMACTDSSDIRLVMCSNPKESNSDIRVAFYSPGKQRITDVSGKVLYRVTSGGWGLSFKKADVAVEKEKGGTNRLLDVGYTEKKKTVIAYASAQNSSNSTYKITEVKGKKKRTTDVAESGKAFYTYSYYFGGVAISEKNPNVLYISRNTGKYWQIEQWKRSGKKWKRVKILQKSRSKALLRPFLTKYAKGEINFSAGMYNPKEFKKYNTKIVRKIVKEK